MGWRKKSSRSKTSWVKKAVTGLSSSLDQFEIIRHEAHERRGTDSTKRTKRYVCAYVTAVDEEGAKKMLEWALSMLFPDTRWRRHAQAL